MYKDRQISVIMGVYNCANTLASALDCIINQTFENWEIVMCDDGSSDDTFEIATKYKNNYPEKIILLKNEQNMGLNATLNKCLAQANGKYIARMDGDDLCSPDRFEKELKVLIENPDIAIVSTDMSLFDENGVFGITHKEEVPTKRTFIHDTPFCHAPCMVRKDAYLAVGGYSVSKRLLRVEDYHLWVKMYEKGYRGINIPECLYQMRDDRNAIKRRKFKFRLNAAYVKGCAIKHLKLPFYKYIFCIKPIILGLVPTFIYKWLHKRRYKDR